MVTVVSSALCHVTQGKSNIYRVSRIEHVKTLLDFTLCFPHYFPEFFQYHVKFYKGVGYILRQQPRGKRVTKALYLLNCLLVTFKDCFQTQSSTN